MPTPINERYLSLHGIVAIEPQPTLPHRTRRNTDIYPKSLADEEGAIAHMGLLVKQMLLKCGPRPPVHGTYWVPTFRSKEKLFLSARAHTHMHTHTHTHTYIYE